MAISVSELLALFDSSSGSGVFELPGSALGIPEVSDLFDVYLGGGLSLSVPVFDREALEAAGVCDIPELGVKLATRVHFAADAGRMSVVGCRVAVEAPSWVIETQYLQTDLTRLRPLGFDPLSVVFAALPDALGGARPEVYLTVAFPAGSPARRETVRVLGAQSAVVGLSGDFPDAPAFDQLADLAALPFLDASVMDLVRLPEEISGRLGSLSLTSVSAAFDRYLGRLEEVSVALRLQGDASWPLIPGLVELDRVDPLRLDAVRERAGAWQVDVTLGVRCTVRGSYVLDGELALPAGRLSAVLWNPAGGSDLIGDGALTGTGIDPAGVQLRFIHVSADVASRSYTLALALDARWHLAADVVLTGLELRSAGTGASVPGVTLAGTLDVGGTPAVLEGRRRPDGVWEVEGSAFQVDFAGFAGWFEQTFGVPVPQAVAGLAVDRVTLSLASDLSGRVWCAGSLPLGDGLEGAAFALDARVGVKPPSGKRPVEFSASLTVGVEVDGQPRVVDFTGDFGADAAGSRLTLEWASEQGIPMQDLMAALGVDLPDLPKALRPELQALSVRYDSATGEVLLTAATERTGWVYASRPGTGAGSPRSTAAAVRARLGARASDLPLVGEAMPPGADLVLDAIVFTSTPTGWTADQAALLNSALDQADSAAERRLPRFAADRAAGPGTAVQIELSIGGVSQVPLVLPITTGAGGALVAVPLGPLAVRAADEGWSRELDLVFGPVRFSGIGIGFADGQIFVALDAVLSVGPVRLILMGLGLGIDGELDVAPRLRGAGVQLDQPPLRISGMVERRTGSEVAPGLKEQFVGLAAIETGFFALNAAGSYAKAVDGWSSLFLFGEISGGEQGLFGPPPFRVIAISLGFGVNSTVRTPTIDQVGEFPLVNRLDGVGSGDTPAQVLEKLAGPGGWITPREGQYWGAGGIEFSSFEFLRSRALLLVEGGESWKVLLIGRTTIDLPRSKAAKKPIARIVIDLAIGYHHDQGLFSMDAVIAPGSYVIDPAAELTGGLSLYIWGQDRTALGGGKGFVFTLGGYHKNFKKPDYYPDPPRVGWRWAIGPVAIRGQVYAALTDGAFMAGGELSANYDKGHGIQLQAWFTAWLDALVQWKPFYFDLSMGLNIGVAATVKVLFIRVRVSLEVGVELDLWGPPIGGRAKIKVWFISFTVEFGTGRDGVPAIDWAEFSVQLPAPLSIAPLRGLLVDVDPEESAIRSAAGEPLLVSMDGFAVRTEAAVPASRIVFNGQTFEGTATDTIDIRPMGPKGQGVASEHHVTLHWNDSPDYYTPTGWGVAVYRQDMPKAMWGKPLGKPSDVLDGSDGLLSGCLAGLTFEIPKPELAPAVGWVDAEALDVDGLPDAPIPQLGSTAQGPPSTPDDGSIATIVDPATGIAAPPTAPAAPRCTPPWPASVWPRAPTTR